MDFLRVLINVVTLAVLIFETWRTVREANRHGEIADRASRFLIAICLVAAFALTINYGNGKVWAFGHLQTFEICGLVLMVGGLALRIWAVLTLGKFFTGTVMIQSDHRVVNSGPYRVLRHPSYTAAALYLLGFALSTASAAAMIVMFIGTVISFGYRIYVEERALVEGLGENYREYAAKTKRVIPYVF